MQIGQPREKRAQLWERHTDDWYVEPLWCSERLFHVEQFDGAIWDPACGGGNIVKSALASGYHVTATDKVKRWDGARVLNFLEAELDVGAADNIVSNPPFKHAQEFVEVALAIACHKVAMLLPAAWVQGDKRSRWLESTPLETVYFIAPRPSMPPGEVIAAGQKPGNGTTDFAWFVWNLGPFPLSPRRPLVKWLRKNP